MRLRWPWPRRRNAQLVRADQQLLEAEMKRRRAHGHYERVVEQRDQASELARWAREATEANRFDVRVEAALWRTIRGD